MREVFEKIIEYELKFTELASKQFSDKNGITRENVREVLEQRGVEIRHVIKQTNDLIDQHITPFLKDPEAVTFEQAIEFQEFAEKLSGYKQSIDTGLSYDIRDALTKYAKANGNEAMYIKNMFFKGLALFYLEGTLFKADMSKCYDKVIAFSDRYHEFDRETRNLIARAYGNAYISVADLDLDEIFRRYDRAKNFWENVAMKHDPDFAWEAFFQNLNENICSTTISALRSYSRTEAVKKEYIKRLLMAAKESYENYTAKSKLQTNDHTTTKIKRIYYLIVAKYYNGLATITDVVEFLYRSYHDAEGDYSYDDLYKKLQCSALFLYYMSYVDPETFSEEFKTKLTKEVESEVFDYVKNIPETVSRSYVTTLLSNFAVGSHGMFDQIEYLKLLLSLTVYRHPPTFAHSVMVSKIAFTIVVYLANHYPEKLFGLPNINNNQQLESELNNLLTLVWYSGLLHDIGKIVYSHMISFYVRKLNDKEFEMIKQHSSKSVGFIRDKSSLDVDAIKYKTIKDITFIHKLDSSELVSFISDVALGHHKSFNGKFGYPANFDNVSSPIKTIIDIISIADTIDAATDNIGRSYASEKTLEHLREDMLSQIGTRYCPFVTKLIFEDQKLFDSIQDLLDNFRYEVYYSCFSNDDLSNAVTPPAMVSDE